MCGDPDTHEMGFYGRLGLSPEASPAEVSRAYRRLAHSSHPDTHPGDPDASRRFVDITEAYEVLSDTDRRARYDQERLRSAAYDAGGFSHPRPHPRPSPEQAGPPSPFMTVSPSMGDASIIVGAGPVGSGSDWLVAGPVEWQPDTCWLEGDPVQSRSDPGWRRPAEPGWPASLAAEMAGMLDALRSRGWW